MSEEWCSEDEAVKLLAVEDIPDIDPAVFAKHLNLAYEKGKQIGSGQAASKLDLMSAELERVNDQCETFTEIIESLGNKIEELESELEKRQLSSQEGEKT